ncbi:MAG: ATP-binding protein [Oscillatoria sp. SIO1A7]|nr:ATP-binding protein [Oscillatoria sp. SIO1A7]
MKMLDDRAIAQIQLLQSQAASLLLYQEVLDSEVGQTFLNLLQLLCDRSDTRPCAEKDCLRAYGRWFKALATRKANWQDYLIARILRDDNPFSRQASSAPLAELSPGLIAAASHDLQVLQNLYSCTGEQISQWVQEVADYPTDLPAPSLTSHPPADSISAKNKNPEIDMQKSEHWADLLEPLAESYRQNGTGLFAEYRALRWQSGQLTGIPRPDPIQLTGLAGYQWQRDALIKNTEFLMAGLPALHVLLYGSRGTGKSSLVKALLNEYGSRGLRLIEVAKSDLKDLPAIVELLRDVPQKFIIFVDDLSFEEDDDAFKALKVVLEGSATARPANVAVYATSNRRHLVREFFDDRPRPSAEEINAWDSVQEKLSFSDRFGLTVTFEPANQNTYLGIIRHLASLEDIVLPPEDLEYRALQWATRHNGRSGRSARQFIDFLRAELGSK